MSSLRVSLMVSISTKVVGVSFRNDPQDGGEDRQAIIDRYIWGRSGPFTIKAYWEPGNIHDRNAIAIYFDGHKIGHLSRSLARDLAPHIRAGGTVHITDYTITGAGLLHYGVNLTLAVID